MDFELPAAVITGMPHRLNHLPTVPGFSVDMFSPRTKRSRVLSRTSLSGLRLSWVSPKTDEWLN